MQYTDITFYKNLLGGSSVMFEGKVGATAVKAGDPIIAGATADVVIPMTASDQQVRGVAVEDAAVGETVLYWPAFPWYVFAIKCASTKYYDDSADRMTQCDFTDFTSGAMKIDPATASGYDVLMIGLADDESDETAENVVQCIFVDTDWANNQDG